MRADLDQAVRAKADDLEKLVELKITEVSESSIKHLETIVSRAETKLDSAITRVDTRVFDLEFIRLKDKMLNNPSANMALSDALGLLNLCIKRDVGKIPDIIHFMLNTIEKGGKLTAEEITRVNAVLSALPSHYSTLTEKLGASLIASDIFG